MSNSGAFITRDQLGSLQVNNALQIWDKQGSFVFTSSSGVLCPPPGEDLTEDTPLHAEGTSDRVDRSSLGLGPSLPAAHIESIC